MQLRSYRTRKNSVMACKLSIRAGNPANSGGMTRIAVGTSLYGKCDQIQNVGHVAHYFFHVGYSPIVPLRSVFVLEKDESEIKLPFCKPRCQSTRDARCTVFNSRPILSTFQMWADDVNVNLPRLKCGARAPQYIARSSPINVMNR